MKNDFDCWTKIPAETMLGFSPPAKRKVKQQITFDTNPEFPVNMNMIMMIMIMIMIMITMIMAVMMVVMMVLLMMMMMLLFEMYSILYS